MNRIRGIPDPVSLNERFPNCLVPDDSGFSGFDLVNNKLFGSQRTSEYSYSDVELYLSNISSTTPQPTIHHSELAHLLSLLKHRLSHLLNNHSIILPQFDIIFGLVNSRSSFISSHQSAIGFRLLSTTNAVSSNQFITDIEDFDFSAFKSFDYCFVLEYHIILYFATSL